MVAAERIAIDELNRSCQCVGTDIDSLRAWLDADLQARGVSEPIVSTHPHLFARLPVFVAREHVDAMQKIIAAIEAAVQLPAYRAAVLARAPSIAQVVPAARGVFLGYDFHMSSDGPKLIEINTNAGGAMLNAEMARAQQACCTEVAEYLRSQPDASQLEERIFAMFIEEWRLSRGMADLRTIAIVDEAPRQQYLYPEFLLFQRLFESRGIGVAIVAPEELNYRNQGLWRQDRRIDLVYNRLTDFYLQAPAHEPLVQAYRNNAIVMSPHPHAHALYANKRNLALLSDERFLRATGVPKEVIETLLAGIPQTLPIEAQGVEQWWSDRKRWFFKPASGFGGRGSYRGEKLTRKAFSDLLQADYVAQRLVPPTERWLSVPDNSALKFDVRNYAYGGRTQLLAARLYQGQTTNFRTQGGGFAPVYELGGWTTRN